MELEDIDHVLHVLEDLTRMANALLLVNLKGCFTHFHSTKISLPIALASDNGASK